MMTIQIIRATLNRFGAPDDPDGVLAAGIRAAVEPAVATLDLEAALLEQHPPFERRQPGKRHRRLAGRTPDGEGERPRRRVPIRAFEDARLALQPTSVRLGDVVVGGLEDVEHETTPRHEKSVSCGEGATALPVVAEVEV